MWHEDKPAVSLMPHGQCEDRKCAVPRGSHLQYEEVVQHKERVYCQYWKGLMRRRSALSRMSHLLYKETKCAVSGGLHLEYEEKLCSVRRECTVQEGLLLQ